MAIRLEVGDDVKEFNILTPDGRQVFSEELKKSGISFDVTRQYLDTPNMEPFKKALNSMDKDSIDVEISNKLSEMFKLFESLPKDAAGYNSRFGSILKDLEKKLVEAKELVNRVPDPDFKKCLEDNINDASSTIQDIRVYRKFEKEKLDNVETMKLISMTAIMAAILMIIAIIAFTAIISTLTAGVATPFMFALAVSMPLIPIPTIPVALSSIVGVSLLAIGICKYCDYKNNQKMERFNEAKGDLYFDTKNPNKNKSALAVDRLLSTFKEMARIIQVNQDKVQKIESP